jgi:hypothetical protein
VVRSAGSTPSILESSAGARKALQRWEAGKAPSSASPIRVVRPFHAPEEVARLAHTELSRCRTNPAIVQATILHKAGAALVAALRGPKDGIPLPEIAAAVRVLFVQQLQNALSIAVAREKDELEFVGNPSQSREITDTSRLSLSPDPELAPSAAEVLLELTRWKQAWPELFGEQCPHAVRRALSYIGEDFRTTLLRIREADSSNLAEEVHTFAPYFAAAEEWRVPMVDFPLSLGPDARFGQVGGEDLRALSVAYEMQQFPGVSSPAPAPLGRLLDTIERAERSESKHFLAITAVQSAIRTLEAIAWGRVRTALFRLAGTSEDAVLRAGPMAAADLEEVLTRPGKWPERLELTSPAMELFALRAGVLFDGEMTDFPDHLRERFAETLERSVARLLSIVHPDEMSVDGGGLVVRWARDALERGVTLSNSELAQWQIRRVVDALEDASTRLRARLQVMRLAPMEWQGEGFVIAREEASTMAARSKAFSLQLLLFVELTELCIRLQPAANGGDTELSILPLDLLGEQGFGLRMLDGIAEGFEGSEAEESGKRIESRGAHLRRSWEALERAQRVVDSHPGTSKSELLRELQPIVLQLVEALTRMAQADRAQVFEDPDRSP